MPKTIWGFASAAFMTVVCAPIGVVVAVGESILEDKPLEDSVTDVYESFKESVSDVSEFADKHSDAFNLIVGPIIGKKITDRM